MARRYAILEDNQVYLESRIAELRDRLPALLQERFCGAAVIGSVAEGRARDDSDLDLLAVLREGRPRRVDYEWWDERVAPGLATVARRFPVQPVIVGRDALRTGEPNLRGALRTAIPVWDPEELFDDQSEARA